MTQATAQNRELPERKWRVLTSGADLKVVIGKDILEILTTAMYVNPLTIFREYVQNSTDAIDEAVSAGILGSVDESFIEIRLNTADRRITIRDNGVGTPGDEFETRLTAIGASKKRGTSARGFRGVGRLCGLGYCQTIIFRSKGPGDDRVKEIQWDCRALRNILRSSEFSGDVADVIRQIVTISSTEAALQDAPFFEVTLDKVVRVKNDVLLNEHEVGMYLVQVAPIPFHKDFSFGAEIADFLKHHLSLKGFNIFLGTDSQPLLRPFSDSFRVTETKKDTFENVEFFETESINGGPSAVGWLLHSNYTGAIQQQRELKGLRARVGGIQVGRHNIFEEIFSETRFNSWVVGELHILDKGIVPNARRDNFEQNVHFSNLVNQLFPLGRAVARRCRNSSIARNTIKSFYNEQQKVNERLQIIKQGAISKRAARSLGRDIGTSLSQMEHWANSELLPPGKRAELKKALGKAKKQTTKLNGQETLGTPLDKLPASRQKAYKEVFDLIYECSSNRVAAKSLVDKILARITFLAQ